MKIKLGTFGDQELEKRQLKVLIRNNLVSVVNAKKRGHLWPCKGISGA